MTQIFPEYTAAELAAIEAVRSVLHRYCQAIDRLDADLLATIYHDDAVVDHGQPMPADQFRIAAFDRLASLWVATHHQLGQIAVMLDGDSAACETYITANHIGPPDGEGRSRMLVLGGRYVDRFERRDGAWRIAHRVLMRDWQDERPYQPPAGWTTPRRPLTPGEKDH
jgi:ketosteroid isomerase-like protein